MSRRRSRARRFGSSATRRREPLHVAAHRTRVAASERAAISAMTSSGRHAAALCLRRPPLGCRARGETGTSSPSSPPPAMSLVRG